MLYKEYPQILAENDTYITDPEKVNHFFNSSLHFYFNAVRIITYSNRQARKGVYNDIQWVASSLDVLFSLERSGVIHEITGMNNLKGFEGPAVFVGNHMSTLETFVLPSVINPVKPVLFVIKEELVRFPLFGKVAGARYPILVGRENPREDLKIVMEEGSKRLQEGRSIIIFPQKTRNKFFDPKGFNSLGVKLAKKNNVPVIPVAIVSDAWGTGKILKDFGKIDPTKKAHIAIGEPIFISGNGADDHTKTVDFILDHLKKWGREDLIVNESAQQADD